VTGDKVLEAIKGTGGVMLKTSLDHRANWPCATRWPV